MLADPNVKYFNGLLSPSAAPVSSMPAAKETHTRDSSGEETNNAQTNSAQTNTAHTNTRDASANPAPNVIKAAAPINGAPNSSHAHGLELHITHHGMTALQHIRTLPPEAIQLLDVRNL